jgi:hypothetical protein
MYKLRVQIKSKLKMKRTVLTISFFAASVIEVFTQTYNQPNVALKSHETLEISKVEINSKATTIFLSVENRITGGYFCADKNIFIIFPDGTRSRMISSKGIPVCPETYKFKTIGEKLNFELTFPPLKHDERWIDLVEDCSDNCISLFGICLDNDLNKKIDAASVLAENKEPAQALISFIKIADTIDSKDSEIEGMIYVNIIMLAKETGNDLKAAEWYKKLKSSGIPRCESYIKHLNSLGILY